MDQYRNQEPPLDKEEAKRQLFLQEQKYLRKVLAYIAERRLYLEANIHKRSEENHSLLTQSWEEHMELSGTGSNAQMDSAYVQNELYRNEQAVLEQTAESKLLAKIRKSPFFGHIRFRFLEEEDEEVFDHYIGLKDIIDEDNSEIYVLDWRSPLASVYYNESELGPTSYNIRERRLSIDLMAKFQDVIQDSQLIRVLDTSEQVVDEILQMVLGSMSSAKMKAIAHTIQKEQNQIIRSEVNRTMIIQGVAGSGKTSIALHRAAYMMYRHPDLKADNILLISPSESFASYISQVLPNLGEENVRSMTIQQVQRQELADVEERYRDYHFLPAGPDKWQQMSRFCWVEWIEEFMDFLADNVFQPRDIHLPNINIPARTLHQLYHINYRHLPPFRRRDSIVRHMGDLIENRQDYQQAVDTIQQQLHSMFLIQDLRQTYEVFTRWACEEKNLKPSFFTVGNLTDADMSLLALLKISLYGPSSAEWVRHLIVDEMQDLTGMAHEMLRKIFSCPRTLLGDVNQAIKFPLEANYLQKLRELYKRDTLRTEFYELRTSYRSTKEITVFGREILQDESIQPLERHGSPVGIEYFTPSEEEREIAFLYKKLLSWRESGYKTAAVICRDEKEADLLRAKLLKQSEQDPAYDNLIFNEYLREESDFAVTVCDVNAAKGVEFDCTIVRNASRQNYPSELDRIFLYVATTRALHELQLTVLGEASPWLPQEEAVN